MKIKFLIISLLIFSANAFGQSHNPSDSTLNDNHYIFGIHTGTSGFGLNFKYNFLNHSSIRFGASVIPLSYSTVQNLGSNFQIDAKASYNNLHLFYEYQILKKRKGIKLVLGSAYFTNAITRVKLTPQEGFDAGITTLTAEEIGNLTISIDSKGFAPYLGLGIGKTISNKRFNLNFDLGSYYLTRPTAKADGTKLLSDNEAIGTILTENLKDYRWLPVIQLNLNYIIK